MNDIKITVISHEPMAYTCPVHGRQVIPAPPEGWPIHENITLACSLCLSGLADIADAASVPPHVAATDARRAAEMKRVTNAKLGEWSQALSLIIHDLSGLKQPRAEIGRRLEALQSDIVRAMGTREE